MRVLNATRGSDVVTAGKRADNFLTRLVGLMGKGSIGDGFGLLIEPCDSIHMFFMRFPIDALYVDRDGRVLRVCRNLRPWRVGPFVRRSQYVLELPAGTAERTGTREGDQLQLVE